MQHTFASIKGISGELTPVLGVVKVSFSFNQVQVIHPVYVAHIAKRAIIGMDFLTSVGAIIDLNEGYLQICGTRVDIPIPSTLGTPTRELIDIGAADTVDLEDIVGRLKQPLKDLYRRSSEGLNSAQKVKLGLLLENYQPVFSSDRNDVGRTSIVKH